MYWVTVGLDCVHCCFVSFEIWLKPIRNSYFVNGLKPVPIHLMLPNVDVFIVFFGEWSKAVLINRDFNKLFRPRVFYE